MQLPAQAARQLPDQSTTLRVDSSSTDDSRLRGALPTPDVSNRSNPAPYSMTPSAIVRSKGGTSRRNTLVVLSLIASSYLTGACTGKSARFSNRGTECHPRRFFQVGGSGTAEPMLMPSAKEYRQRAQECLQLAEAATQAYAILELAELAAEFNKAADDLERKSDAVSIRRPRLHKPT